MSTQGTPGKQPGNRPFFYAPDAEAEILAGNSSRIYCVGICGTGLSALALFLAGRGHTVTGSDDRTDYYPWRSLQEAGITVEEGFHRRFGSRADADLLLYSAAYDPRIHPQLLSAQKAGVPLLSYPEALSRLSGCFHNICVAGTHGKTTTAMMIYLGLQQAGIEASPLFGVPAPQSRASYPVLVIEACEYREHFLMYYPEYAVITSVDYDHVDVYPDRFSYRKAFQSFAANTQKTLVVSGEDADIPLDVASSLMTYGAAEGFAYRAVKSGTGSGEPQRYMFLPWELESTFFVPGDHIASDALAALLAVYAFLTNARGKEPEKNELAHILKGISSYRGALRRSEVMGTAAGILFMDDYAHHPAEIRAMFQGLRQRYPDKRIVADFIPHTVSRTRSFFSEFTQSLSLADVLCIQEIYPSQREQHAGDPLSSAELAACIPGARFFSSYQSAYEFLLRSLQSNDLFITMGAGDNRFLGVRLLDAFNKRNYP